MSNFDFVSKFYDKLSYLVFGNNIKEANQELVKWVGPHSNALILGGGTGELLEHFIDDSVLVDYVELSFEMIELSKARKSHSTNTFYNQDFLKFNSDTKYDYILCPFFLDLFVHKELMIVIDKIKRQLNVGGKLLVADFNPEKTIFFNKLLHRIMVLFFRLFSSIKITAYNDLFDSLEQNGFTVEQFMQKRSNFIEIKKFTLQS